MQQRQRYPDWGACAKISAQESGRQVGFHQTQESLVCVNYQVLEVYEHKKVQECHRKVTRALLVPIAVSRELCFTRRAVCTGRVLSIERRLIERPSHRSCALPVSIRAVSLATVAACSHRRAAGRTACRGRHPGSWTLLPPRYGVWHCARVHVDNVSTALPATLQRLGSNARLSRSACWCDGESPCCLP